MSLACPLKDQSCPLVNNSCSKGCYVEEDEFDCDDCCDLGNMYPPHLSNDEETDDWWRRSGIQSQLNRNEENEATRVERGILLSPNPVNNDLGVDYDPEEEARRLAWDNAHSGYGAHFNARSAPNARQGRGGGGRGGRGGNRRSEGNILPGPIRGLIGGATRGILNPYPAYPGYPSSYPSYPGYAGGGIRRRRPFFPGSFAGLGWLTSRLFNPYASLYSSWYPVNARPIFVIDDRTNQYVLNSEVPTQYPTLPLPYFETQLPFSAYTNRDSISAFEQQALGEALQSINDQYTREIVQGLALRPEYKVWLSNGFAIVPDLTQHKFVWVYRAMNPNTTIYGMKKLMALSCATCGGVKEKLIKNYNRDDVIFDLYGKYEDKFTGMYILKNGDVYSYIITPGVTHDKDVIETKFIGNRTTEKEMSEMMRMVKEALDAPVIQERHDSGPVVYTGMDENGNRVQIHGDDDTTSEASKALVMRIRALVC